MKPATAFSSRHRGAPQRQHGMALLIALIVLIVVSILGVVAMRSAMFQNRISINSQITNLSFQAAESGLQSVVKMHADQVADGKPVNNPANFLNIAVNQKAQRVCYTKDAVSFDGDTRIGTDGNITYGTACLPVSGTNSAVTTVVGPAKDAAGSALEAFDVKYGGGLILIEARAQAEVPNTHVRSLHVQQWGVIGPSDSEGG